MNCTVRAITTGPKHHFFGYYDQRPWDHSGRYHLVLETDFMDRPPTANDAARVAIVDLEDGNRLVPLARTRAWNFQQGTMLHWRPGQQRIVLFNDRRDGQFVCVAHEVDSGTQHVLGPAIAALSEDGKLAATLNFARIAVTRPGYGYEGLADPFAEQLAPDGDGLGVLDIEAGEHRIVVSMAQLAPLQEPQLEFSQAKVWFNHVLFNPSGTRLSFLCRWIDKHTGNMWDQLWTTATDGGDLVRALDGPMVSHYDWKDDETLIAWCGIGEQTAVWEFDALRRADRPPRALFTDTVKQDGHVCFSHDRRYVATDTYPDNDGMRRLSILDYATGRETELGEYYSPRPAEHIDIRCDFHPSWRDDDRALAFDGMHEGTRQRYIVEFQP